MCSCRSHRTVDSRKGLYLFDWLGPCVPPLCRYTRERALRMRVERNQIVPAPQQLQAVMPGPYVLVQSQTGGMQMVQMADMSMVMPMQPPVSARRRSGADVTPLPA